MARVMSRAHLDVTTLTLAGCESSSNELGPLLELLRGQARKKHVTSAAAMLRLGEQLVVPIEVHDRGARLKVPGRGMYACSVDGLLNAIADVIRQEHGGDVALLDLYQELLLRNAP
jgi:hypothetical protein